MANTISVKDLTKKFGELTAVDKISFQVNEGEIFGLLGPNGAGKTTTIKMLTTLLPPTSGDATVAGYDIRKQQNDVRKSIGIVFQDPSLDDDLTAEENLLFHAALYGISKIDARPKIEEVLKLVDLSDRKKDFVKTFSGGMKRRLEIARSLMHTPEVLFLDEPTTGLDIEARRRMWAQIRALRAAGKTVLLTTHYLEEADQLADRIVVLKRGKIAADGTPNDIKLAGKSEDLDDAFLNLTAN